MAEGRAAYDALWRGLRLSTQAEGAPAVVGDGVVAARGGRIAYAGPAAGLPPGEAARVFEGEGRLATPSLVDPHTHLVHAGHRAGEFAARLAGASYEAIARSGGGILSTVRATRAASEEDLLAASLRRLDRLLEEGVTTVEIKSGYGLDLGTEARCLRVARRLAGERPVSVTTTFLGAHALPPERAGDAAGYVDFLIGEVLPALRREGLVDAVDAFLEGIAFDAAQVRRLFAAARATGLPVKLHADQLSDLGGAALAAEHGALSADHLEWTSEDGAAALARAGTVAVLLPGAYYTLRETRRPPVGALRRHGARIALATDCNPGSSPLTSPLLAMNMAAVLFGLTVEECLAGFTREAARALGLLADRGTLEAGKRCDLALWDVGEPAELVYRLGDRPLHARVFGGEPT